MASPSQSKWLGRLSPNSGKENPSAWETAIGLIDAIAKERSADQLKKIILNFETMCQFDLVFFPGNPQ
jgi:thiaminase